MQHLLSRRDVLQKCAALGGLVLATPLSLDAAIDLIHSGENGRLCPTPSDSIGPFYKKFAPARRVLRTASDPGVPLSVQGRVFNSRGDALVGATIEIWHADHWGHYDIEGYRFRTKLVTGKDGDYAVESVMPGHYPDRVSQHVHYLITAPGHKPLVTQLYFATDPVFEGDPAKNFKRDPSLRTAELIRPVVLTGDSSGMRAAVVFDLCLERL